MTLRIVLLVVLLAYGLPLAYIGQLGWRQRLSLTGRLGVRTPAAARDYETFQLANRVSGPPVFVAGLVAVVGGIVAFAVPPIAGTITAAVIGFAGAVLIARAGSVLGDRAAQTVREREPAGCAGGCACGCSSSTAPAPAAEESATA
ncbi:MAG TPA: SdpI family protein [Pseudonocardiaceae bacterium]|nr:SdpI family protein [Pseudonocardiaceae bacterium]